MPTSSAISPMTKALISFFTAACLLLAALLFTTRPAKATFSPEMLQGGVWGELGMAAESMVYEAPPSTTSGLLTVPPGQSFFLESIYQQDKGASAGILVTKSGSSRAIRLEPGLTGSGTSYRWAEHLKLDPGDKLEIQNSSSITQVGYITGFWVP